MTDNSVEVAASRDSGRDNDKLGQAVMVLSIKDRVRQYTTTLSGIFPSLQVSSLNMIGKGSVKTTVRRFESLIL